MEWDILKRAEANRARMAQAQPMTRRVIKVAIFAFVGLMVLYIFDMLLRFGGGWAGNPWWGFVLVANLIAIVFAVTVFYSFLYISSRSWVEYLIVGLTAWVGYALAMISVGETLPMLSTYVFAEEQQMEVEQHAVRRSTRRRAICKTAVKFGPIWSARGSTCNYYPNVRTRTDMYLIEGYGNAFGVRVVR